MSLSLKSRVADCIEHPTPARVILLFLGSMISFLLATLALAQLNLPYYGKTVWDLGMAGLAWVFGYVPALANMVASQYTFVVGAFGVLWLTAIYFRARRTRQYKPRVFDRLMAVLSVGLFYVYYAHQDQVLPFQASFFSRLALYCAIAVVSFCVILLVADKESALEAAGSDENGGSFFFALLIGAASAFATAFHGGDVAAVSFWGFQLPNAILHFIANFGGLAMGIWFYEEVAKLTKGEPSAESTDSTESNREEAKE
ncbi:hypothetical protein [Burkholderia ubonensis]|uniref:hypothetical protein n=1 Tax=Burkholderia ubonensis TaxID=101571 RepID=UPI00075DC241|nr:hypothetical protein [Burkholderia ubonensis]KVP17033.1 hypothetical protein WJ84_01795 [Burkholderia ubonensis]